MSRLLTVLAAIGFGASGFADDWRPTTVGTPYAPAVGNPYVPAFPSGYYGPAPATQPGETPPSPGSQQPAVVGSPCEPNGCFNQDCPQCCDPDCSHAPVWGSCEEGICWDCCFCDLGRWYVTADALWLKRNRPNNNSLTIREPEDGPDAIILETDDLKFDMQAGTRLTIGRYIGPSTSIEGTFFGFHDWNAFADVRGFDEEEEPLLAYWIGSNNDGAVAHRTDAFDGASRQSANYSSEVWNWELGVRRQASSDGSILLGFRYMAVNEDFAFRSVAYDPPKRGIYEIDTRNDLVGVQIGGEQIFRVPQHRIRFALFGKAGLFVNFHEQQNRLSSRNADGSLYGDIRDNESERLSSVLEFGAVATLQLSEHIALRGGYNCIFINGLALAADQLDQSPDRSNSRLFVNDNGDLYLHGPFVGGEFLLP